MKKLFLIAIVSCFVTSVVAFAQDEKNTYWVDMSLSTGFMSPGNPGQTDYAGNVTIGWRANNKVVLGAGIMCSGMIKTGAVSFPVFLKVRYDILDKFVSPYVSVAAGWAFNAYEHIEKYDKRPLEDILRDLDIKSNYYHRDGLYASAMAGVAVKNGQRGRFYLGVGVDFSQYRKRIDYPGKSETVMLVPESASFFHQIKPALRFQIGYEF